MLKGKENDEESTDHLSVAKKVKSFKDLHLDDRLIKAVAKVRWPKPTLVQAATLPLSIEGRDIICKSKTGSGNLNSFHEHTVFIGDAFSHPSHHHLDGSS